MLGETREPHLLRHSQLILRMSNFSRLDLSKHNYRSATDVAAPSLRLSPPEADELYVEFLPELQLAIANP